MSVFPVGRPCKLSSSVHFSEKDPEALWLFYWNLKVFASLIIKHNLFLEFEFDHFLQHATFLHNHLTMYYQLRLLQSWTRNCYQHPPCSLIYRIGLIFLKATKCLYYSFLFSLTGIVSVISNILVDSLTVVLTSAGSFTMLPFKFHWPPLGSSLSSMKARRGKISLSSGCVNFKFLWNRWEFHMIS